MAEQEITIGELASMIKEGFDSVGEQIGELKADVAGLKTDVAGLKTDVVYLKSQMVTKEYLDGKIAGLRGDIIDLLRKEDKRVSSVVSLLERRAVISNADAREIDALRPLLAVD